LNQPRCRLIQPQIKFKGIEGEVERGTFVEDPCLWGNKCLEGENDFEKFR